MYNNLLRQRHVYYPDPILRFSLVVTYNGNQVGQVERMCHEHPDPIHIISAISTKIVALTGPRPTALV